MALQSSSAHLGARRCGRGTRTAAIVFRNLIHAVDLWLTRATKSQMCHEGELKLEALVAVWTEIWWGS